MNGWQCEDGVNSFALVGYLPEPLGSFIDGLRLELDPDYRAQAHVTILPPRPLNGSPEAAWGELRQSLQNVPAFPVVLGEVELFPGSDVIYISIRTGFRELEHLHRALNRGLLEFSEPWRYHPHVTLVQGRIGETSSELDRAAKRWSQFHASRRFLLNGLTFVQFTLENRWMDLARTGLHPGVPV